MDLPALRRGTHELALGGDAAVGSPAISIEVGNSVPVIRAPARVEIAEEETSVIGLDLSDFDQDPLRVWVAGLPPGARWDEQSRRITFRPTFIQGGRSYRVQVTASDGLAQAEASLELVVDDTIHPEDPVVVRRQAGNGWSVVTLRQKTDAFLDSPGYAGRSFEAELVVPSAASAEAPMPVQVRLHAFDADAPGPAVGSSKEFRLYPHDPMNTYWWGYSELLPGAGPEGGRVQPYTARRVMHLLDYVLRTYPGADPERVWLNGGSMGGAGALAIGLLYARHFSFVKATAAQTVPRHHRPSRMKTLSELWGTPEQGLEGGDGVGIWDWLDLTRVLSTQAEARDQFLAVWHGKDDTTILFSAAVKPSPLTAHSFLQTLQQEHIGHLALWDEGGHTRPDPVLGDWFGTWDPGKDLRRDQAFPAFTRCSIDRDPGDGSGNGKRSWDAENGYAGKVSVAGDTGWSGEIAGGINRSARWDPTKIVDTPERLELPLRAEDGPGGPSPRPGYPTTGDRLDGSLPLQVDVTPRRTQSFRCLPGERVRWSFGEASGEVQAAADGSVTVPGLSLTEQWTTLVLERAPLER
ncbi:MAG: alpha/beta hydrolase-fold protein [Myxococcales bacterium]